MNNKLTFLLYKIYKSILNVLRLAIFFPIDSLAIKRSKRSYSNSLLLIRLDAIGDYVLFRNFLEICVKNEKFRGYKVTLCGNEIWKNLSENLDKQYIDDFIWINTNKFLKSPVYRFKIMRLISRRRFETAIQPTYSRYLFTGDAIIKASQAMYRIGSLGDESNMEKWQKSISDRYYTRLIHASADCMFEFYRNKEFFENLLDIQIDLGRPIIHMGNGENGIITKGKYAVLFPGGGSKFRRWEPENFAKIAVYLSNKYNLDIIIAGSVEDNRLAKKIISKAKVKMNMIDFTGKIKLFNLTNLLSKAELIISNDTGVTHIAGSLNKRAICISNGFHFGRFVPWPDSITGNMCFIFPKAIMEQIYNIEYLKRKYRNMSYLSINTITPKDVEKIIDWALSSDKVEQGDK